ncbi:MAG: tetratricopeptide repeat protein [Ktedonobacterales bacterium]
MGRMVYRGGQGAMGTIPGGPLGKARFAMANGRFDEAERICRKRLERSPEDAAARLLLAQALLQQGQIADAATEARRVTREQPANADAHLILSGAAMQAAGPLGRIPAEAETAARRAVQLQPKAAKTHVQLAEILASKKDLAGARIEADEAIKLEPRLAGAHLMRAVILLTDKDPNGAIASSDSALRYDRTMSQAELVKANALLEVNRYDDALASLDTAERGNPALLAGGNGRALRGRIYYKKRDFKRSYAQFLSAQMMSGRLRFLAPVISAINMVFVGQFGQSAAMAWGALLSIIILAILFGISFIPVAGQWIVGVLVLGIVGVGVFGFLRQSRGKILPADVGARLTTLVAIVMAFIVGVALALVVIGELGVNVFRSHGWFTPLTMVLAGVVGLVLAGVAAALWPRATARYAGGGGRAAA